MQSVTATDFVNNFGKRNQDVQRETIQVTSHGRPIGYYVSAAEYETLINKRKNSDSFYDTVIGRRSEIKKIAKLHNAKRISLFGSVSRSDDNKDSDVDFLVEFPKFYDLLRDRIGLAQELQDLLGRKIDLIVKSEMEPSLAQSILKDAIEL